MVMQAAEFRKCDYPTLIARSPVHSDMALAWIQLQLIPSDRSSSACFAGPSGGSDIILRSPRLRMFAASSLRHYFSTPGLLHPPCGLTPRSRGRAEAGLLLVARQWRHAP